MKTLHTSAGAALVTEITAVIVDNKAYLSEIDGKIGDGDHGINMAKGFGRTASQLSGGETLDEALQQLSDVLMNEIGGSMGPLYGLMFAGIAEVASTTQTIDLETFTKMLRAGLDGVSEIGLANVGDKTLLDTLVPAVLFLEGAAQDNTDFEAALTEMIALARNGRDSTINMVAKVGRASRLGERSRGVVDAGAASCFLILETLANGIINRLS